MWWRKKKHNVEVPPIPPTYGEFLVLYPLCSQEMREQYDETLKKQPRPDRICSERVPADLNGLTYGQLDDMRDITNDTPDVAYALCEALFGKVLPLYDEDVNVVFGLVNFCAKEIDRINQIFQSIRTEYSAEEKQAGAESLNFGSFGVLDWYAKRMGIIDQNEVRKIAWVRIFQCMKNDHEQAQFEKRLNDVYMHKK